MTKQKRTAKVVAQAVAEPKTNKAFLNLSGIDWLHVILLSVTYWLVYNYVSNPEHIDLNGDNFAYYLLGKTLAAGKGYVNAYNSVTPVPHNHFPPAFPFIVSVLIRLFDADMKDVAFILSILFYVSVLLLYFALNRIQLSKALSFVVLLFVILNPLLLGSANTCMSEIPFVFFSIAGLYFLVSSANDENPFKSWKLFLAVSFFAAGYYTKTIGVSLFGALFLYFLFSKKWKHLLVATVSYIVLLLPWYIRGKLTGSSSYVKQLLQVNPYQPELGNLTLTTFIERVQNNFVRYISLDIPTALFSVKRTTEEIPFSFWILGIVTVVLIVFGIYRLKDYKLFFLAYIAATFVILLAWPDAFGGLRFVEVLIPVFLFLLIYGLSEAVQFVFSKISLLFSPYWLLLLVLFFFSPVEALKNELSQPVSPNFANYFELAKWAKNNTPEDAIFSARKPDMFIYYSGRICVGDKPSLDDKEVLGFFRENGVDYVVLEQLGFSSTPKYLLPALQKNIEKFPVAAQLPNPDTYILKFTEGDR